MKNTLERHRFFPYIAWATVIGFAFFVFQLTQTLTPELAQLEEAKAGLQYSE